MNGELVNSTRHVTRSPIRQFTHSPILPFALLVAREGLEPSKPLGRQIYSLLRLTASLPRQLAVYVGNVMFSTLTQDRKSGPVELAEGFEPPTG